MTARGRAKALQYGALAADIAPSIESCSLCAACATVCPENIDLVEMTLQLRRVLARSSAVADPPAATKTRLPPAPRPRVRVALLPDRALHEHAASLARVAALLGGGVATCHDAGADIALALESGATISNERLEQFLAPLGAREQIVVGDGLLLRHLHRWLPRVRIKSLGETLSSVASVRRGLRASDMYVIEARAYHADYERLVKYYDGLRRECGCSFNLDLQRIAIPAAAAGIGQMAGVADDAGHARWILKGRNVARIVVESLADRAAFERVSALPVVHLADLAHDECA